MTEHLIPEQPQGENPLSEREMDVAQLLATGASNSEIARELTISPGTVKVHIRNIFDKLQASSRTEASMVLVQRGWLTVPGVALASAAPAELPTPVPPLGDMPARPAPWQIVWMLGALGLVFIALWTPTLLAQPQTRSDLLTDAGSVALGQPELEPQARWDARTPLPDARSRLAVAVWDERLYAVGGETDVAVTDQLLAYDLESNTWDTLAPLPQAVANGAAAAIGGHLYVAGGNLSANDGHAVADTLNIYAIADDEWLDGLTLPNPLTGAALVASADALYLLGGWDGVAMRDEVWRLAVDEDGLPAGNWELVTRLRTPRAFFGAVAADDAMYVVGGYDGRQELSDADLFSLTDGRWTALPPLSTPRGGLALVYDGLAVFALGGGWTYPIRTFERYDPSTEAWSNFPSPIQGEWRHLGAAAKDERLHLVGGWSGAYLDTYLQYQSTFRALLPVITRD
jgi:DNA-binding CsgD family transcriptional regulator/N-acetylneuraminic acid mutarotase